MSFFHTLSMQTRESWQARSLSPRPPILSVTCLFIALIVPYLVASIVFHPTGPDISSDFSDERGTVTILSAVLLSSGAAWAYAAYLLAPWREKRYRLFWFFLAVAITFLAIDELFGFHEGLGDKLYDHTALSVLVDHTPLRNLNDAIVILYGVVALPVAILLLPGLVRVPRVLGLIVVAFSFYAIHTVIDSISEPPTDLSMIMEETAKVMCSCFIALAMLTGMRGVVALKQCETAGDTEHQAPQ